MRHTRIAGLMGVMMAVAAMDVAAQVAGSITPGLSVEELKTLALGWSAKTQILDKSVYNDKNEPVGDVDDLIIAPDSSISDASIGVGGVLGLGERQVAIRQPSQAQRGEARAAGRDQRRPAGHAIIPIRSVGYERFVSRGCLSGNPRQVFCRIRLS